MPSQEQQRPSRRESGETEDVEDQPLPTGAPAASSATAEGAQDDVDSLLDEIDDVLESNAEQFVRQYTQKGGQ